MDDCQNIWQYDQIRFLILKFRIGYLSEKLLFKLYLNKVFSSTKKVRKLYLCVNILIMKKSYIIALILIVTSVVIFINASKDVSTYGDFSAAERVDEKIKIVGMLSKDKPVDYNPEKAPNEMSFFLKDQKGVEKKVRLLKAKPQGFEMSEQIVLTGKMQDDTFVASEILMKCPSKYKNEEIAIKGQS